MAGYEIRVGDADREATAAELREHYASGRLTLEELNQRLDQAFAAKTRADLTACMRDLPSAARPSGARDAQQPIGSGGPFGDRGPFGGGPFRAGPSGGGWQSGRGFGVLGTVISMIWLFAVLGLALGFGLGGGRERPFAIIVAVAVFAVLRRLVFGRRRRRFGRRCGRW